MKTDKSFLKKKLDENITTQVSLLCDDEIARIKNHQNPLTDAKMQAL